MVAISELVTGYLSSLCEIKTMANDLISPGYVRKIGEDYIEIASKDDKLPLLGVNTMVKVNIYNEALGLQIIVGNVFLSSDQFVRIVEVESLTTFEKRNFFRIRVDLLVRACLYKEVDGRPAPGEFFEAEVCDLSLSGIFLALPTRFAENQELSVELPFSGIELYRCRIRRTQERVNGKFGYGCEFVDISERQSDFLCQYLFQKQREQIVRARR